GLPELGSSNLAVWVARPSSPPPRRGGPRSTGRSQGAPRTQPRCPERCGSADWTDPARAPPGSALDSPSRYPIDACRRCTPPSGVSSGGDIGSHFRVLSEIEDEACIIGPDEAVSSTQISLEILVVAEPPFARLRNDQEIAPL